MFDIIESLQNHLGIASLIVFLATFLFTVKLTDLPQPPEKSKLFSFTHAISIISLLGLICVSIKALEYVSNLLDIHDLITRLFNNYGQFILHFTIVPLLIYAMIKRKYWTAIFGCYFLIGLTAHNFEPPMCFLVMCGYLFALTLVFRSSFFGFLSVMSLGGSIVSQGSWGVEPSMVLMGGSVIIIYNLAWHMRVPDHILHSFQFAVKLLGKPAVELGLLIMAAEWYPKVDTYILRQIYVLGLIGAYVSVGYLYNMPSLITRATVLISLYGLEKLIGMIPYIDSIWVIMVFVFGGLFLLSRNADTIQLRISQMMRSKLD
jgi:hypothetical protein